MQGEKTKTKAASEKKQRRDKRKAQGLCPECGIKPDDPCFIICSKCRKRILDSVNTRRAKAGKPVHKPSKVRGCEDDSISPEDLAKRIEYVKALSLAKKKDSTSRASYSSLVESLPHPTDSHGNLIFPSGE